ncbi:hypothetical protein V6Z11_A11G262900 [Gossypium hirsutum]
MCLEDPKSFVDARIGTKIEVIVPRMIDFVVYNGSRRDIVRRSLLKKLSMMIFLCHNDHKLGVPTLVKKFASLNYLIQLNVQYLIEL